MWDSHSCACTWSAMVICLAVMNRCLKVSWSGGSSANETSWAISAWVLTWKVPVRLMTIGMILTSAFRVPYVCNATRSGSYISYICSMIVCILPSVEYLHSMICICLRPRNVGSLTSFPCLLSMKPTARMRSGLWCLGLCCGCITYSGMVERYSGFSVLSSCRPSCRGCVIPVRSSWVGFRMSSMRLSKSVTGF